MGLWSGIKYALNSRLGTSTFKSLDKLIDDVQTEVAKSDTASASGTLSQKIRYTNSTLIGATNATKGTATTGTVMGKLRAIIEDGTLPRYRGFTELSASKNISTNTTFTISNLSLVLVDINMSSSSISTQNVNLRGGNSTSGSAYYPLNGTPAYSAIGKMLYLLYPGQYTVQFQYASGASGTYTILSSVLT